MTHTILTLRGPAAYFAVGSAISRATGFLRSATVLAALGTGLSGDGYSVANTVPNILFALLLGGMLNSALIPHLAAARREDPAGFRAHTDRLITAVILALVAITVAATAAAPLIVDLYTHYSGQQRADTVLLARICLPQILGYGLFALLGQLLALRGSFTATAWAPVANNATVTAVFGAYLALGPRSTPGTGWLFLLGTGTTAGVLAQTCALIPALRRNGIAWRPRLAWRGAGLGRPLRAGGWLVLSVATDQLGYLLVTRLSTTAAQHAATQGTGAGVGYAAYSSAFLVFQVPHAIVTVSLVAVRLPRLSTAAADNDATLVRAYLRQATQRIIRTILPASLALIVLAEPIAALAFGHGRTTRADTTAIAGMIAALAPGLTGYSLAYLHSRALYALGDARTPFLLNLIPATTAGAGALACTAWLSPRWAVTGMAGAAAVSFGANALTTGVVLRRRLRRFDPTPAHPSQSHKRARRPKPLARQDCHSPVKHHQGEPAPMADTITAHRRPTPARTGVRTWSKRARTAAGPAVVVYTATTALHLLLLSVMIRPGGPSLTDRLTAWDGRRFVQIAEHGYPHGMDGLADGSNLAFFPLFPQLIRIVHAASGLSWAVSGILAAHLSLAAALIVIHALLSRLYDRRTATIAIVLLAGAQPMSLVFSMAYSESLFLALTAGALLALHKQAWLSAGVLTALAGLTRPAGAAVVLAMAIAVVLYARENRHLPGRAVAGLALGCTGVPLFIGWVGLRSGQLNGWFTIQNAGWGTKWDYGRQFLTDLRDTLALSNEFMAVCTAIVTVVLIVIAIAAFRRHTWPPLLAYGAGILILTLGQSNYFQCKLRLLILALIFLLPPARSLARTDNRTVALALVPATLFGCWFGAFMLTTWHYGI